ncbi:MAG: methyltransferase [Pseudomonadota bacterium]
MVASTDPPDLAPRVGVWTRLREGLADWSARRTADPKFQAWATRFPLTRWVANRQGAQLYDLVAGFVYSQVLLACVELDLLRMVQDTPLTAPQIAARTQLPPERAERLLRAAVSLKLLRLRHDARFGRGPMGAALLGAPGVEEMVRHHPMFYRDLEDPIALLTAPKGTTELAQFWSYVAQSDVDAPQAEAYSRLMAVSQKMVAAETLAVHPMTGITRLMDVGGGEGAFLSAALSATPGLTGCVFDLPEVAARARRRLTEAGMGTRSDAIGGSFLEDPLPGGADAISLVRVLYDHDTPAVQRLLRKIYAALASGGTLVISEPMSGGDAPTRPGDAYFGFYTAAMTSGMPRSAATHEALLRDAGFHDIKALRPQQGFVTRVIRAHKP